MLWEYSYFILYFIFCLALALLILLLSYLLVNRAPNFEKAFPYECGFTPFGDARVQHDVSYYMVAISFIVFDVEIAFLYPWVGSLLAITTIGYTVMLVFLCILVVGFIYEWSRGVLD